MTFPAVTVCNQNRVDCGRLESVMEFCKLQKNMSLSEGHHQKVSNGSEVSREASAEYTICNKRVANEEKSVIQYLFDEGKCGEICWDGKIIYSLLLMSNFHF